MDGTAGIYILPKAGDDKAYRSVDDLELLALFVFFLPNRKKFGILGVVKHI